MRCGTELASSPKVLWGGDHWAVFYQNDCGTAFARLKPGSTPSIVVQEQTTLNNDIFTRFDAAWNGEVYGILASFDGANLFAIVASDGTAVQLAEEVPDRGNMYRVRAIAHEGDFAMVWSAAPNDVHYSRFSDSGEFTENATLADTEKLEENPSIIGLDAGRVGVLMHTHDRVTKENQLLYGEYNIDGTPAAPPATTVVDDSYSVQGAELLSTDWGLVAVFSEASKIRSVPFTPGGPLPSPDDVTLITRSSRDFSAVSTGEKVCVLHPEAPVPVPSECELRGENCYADIFLSCVDESGKRSPNKLLVAQPVLGAGSTSGLSMAWSPEESALGIAWIQAERGVHVVYFAQVGL